LVALLVVAGVSLGDPRDASATDPTTGATTIGRYHVERSGTAIEISRPRDRGLGWLLLAGGLVLAGAGQAVRASGRAGVGTGVVLLGLGLAAVGGIAVLAAERWRANETELVRERWGGRTERWPRAEIAAVAIVRRAVSAEDFKRTGIRPWDVTVRGRDGHRLPVRFSVDSHADARTLAAILGAALTVEVQERR
jgi:hypothetical protein